MSALQKISSQMTMIPNQDLRQAEGMNAFYIIPARTKAYASELLMDHPPLEKRLAALAADRARDGPAGRARRSRVGSSSMGLRDIAFGRKKLPEPRDDRLFALSTASVTLETELGLKTGGQGGDHLPAALLGRVQPRRRRHRAARQAAAAVGRRSRSSARPTPSASSG